MKSIKSTICPDCEGDEFYPCAICYKAMMPDDIDTMTDDEVKSELNQRGIDSELSYWKHRCRIFEVLNRATDGDLRDQMEITGRKEMELTKLRGEMRRMQQNIERLEGIISSAIV